ncbi:precorrin-6x reductase [Desulfofarcimen acetoxidans DSM 771]|jgi:precorrin-6A/cobalt-precorrin-6A reductase|uniref:Precorrin-6x reductase n=1 Tax=Desulfofarcimen acetoxidans (strain ATCC 49208 / DSM 771 / KCTC 5769 / VKM B-1644 / 5575) TaxID=485916 RepID=C8W690_DESAS|nr:precorrin-6A reductase [Desulfofarcimen acetoxidans]ACV62179.1 precorrin-6x reductase [Desulfofarcimen acetoxidans DSM 771]
MILVLSGTGDGRSIIKDLVQKGYQVLAAAATAYGGQLLDETGAAETLGRPLSEPELLELIAGRGIKALVDVTHPYAEAVSEMAFKVCAEMNLPYIRFERQEIKLPEHPLIMHAADYLAAADKAVMLGESIFLTTGSKTLGIFLRAALLRKRRIIARVLPHPRVLQHCLDLGLTPADIVAMQGPFSKQMNIAMLRHYQANVLVTKNSGIVGGLPSKIEAALELQVPVIIVDRPRPVLSGAISSVDTLFQELEKHLQS